MTKVTLNDVTSSQNQTSLAATINANNDAIAAAIEKTLSRDGTSPNTMTEDLNMNSQRIVNLPDGVLPSEPATINQLGNTPTYAAEAAASAAAAAASEANSLNSETNAAASATTAASYAANVNSAVYTTTAALAAVAAPIANKLYFVLGNTDKGDLAINTTSYYYIASSTLAEDTINRSVIPSVAGGNFIRTDMRDTEFDVFLLMGQSNANGSGSGGSWPTNSQCLVWNSNYSATGSAAVPISTRRGSAPFASDSSNNLGASFVDTYNRATGRRAILVLMAKGGTSITEMNASGGVVWDGMIANMTALFAAYPKATLKGFLWHQGEADQFETLAWYTGQFSTLKTNLRAQSWFPYNTPIVVGEPYFGTYSSGAQWRQIDALSQLPFSDPYVGIASSAGLEAEYDASYTDAFGAAYRVHFSGGNLVLYGRRYFGVWNALKDGIYIAPRFSIPDRLGGYPSTVHQPIIVVADGGSYTMTLLDLVSRSIVKCSGNATINLPDISSTSLSSWVRSLTYEFFVFCNVNNKTITINTGNAHTIGIGNASPVSSATIVNTRAMCHMIYMQDTRWRGLLSA